MKSFVTRILFSLFVVSLFMTAAVLVSPNTTRAVSGSVFIAQAVPPKADAPPATNPPAANPPKTTSSGAGLVPCGNRSDDPCTVQDIFRLIALLTNYLVTGAGVFAIVFLVIAGVSMDTSIGNEQKLAEAKKKLTYAVAGLVLVLTAYIIVRFFLYDVLGLQGPNVLEGSPANFINTSGGSNSNTTKPK
jgi:hypothetical protein